MNIRMPTREQIHICSFEAKEKRRWLRLFKGVGKQLGYK